LSAGDLLPAGFVPKVAGALFISVLDLFSSLKMQTLEFWEQSGSDQISPIKTLMEK
jgi:hypothetical protein